MNIYFKIVATVERGGIYFSVVPSMWEKNNILFWPSKIPKKDRELLRSDSASVPDEKTWDRYECTVKCTNIFNFNEALSLEKTLSKCDDTDAETEVISEFRTKGSNQVLPDRNNMFSQDESQCDPGNEKRLAILSLGEDVSNYGHVLNGNLVLDSSSSQQNDNWQLPTNSFNIIDTSVEATLIQEIKSDIALLKIQLEEVRQEMRVYHHKTNITLDKIYDLIKEGISIPLIQQQTQAKTNSTGSSLLENFKFPIKTADEIDELDNRIQSDKSFKSELLEFLKKVGGTSGNQDGVKVAYKLIDIIFDPECLLEFSWTGICREKGSKKKSFQKYEGIIDIFFNVLLLTDCRFTKEKTVCVFRDGILKHAKKRSLRKKITKTKNTENPQINDRKEEGKQQANGQEELSDMDNNTEVEESEK